MLGTTALKGTGGARQAQLEVLDLGAGVRVFKTGLVLKHPVAVAWSLDGTRLLVAGDAVGSRPPLAGR